MSMDDPRHILGPLSHMHPSARGHPDFRSEDAVDYRGITAYEDAEGAGQMEVQKRADCQLHEQAY